MLFTCIYVHNKLLKGLMDSANCELENAVLAVWLFIMLRVFIKSKNNLQVPHEY